MYRNLFLCSNESLISYFLGVSLASLRVGVLRATLFASVLRTGLRPPSAYLTQSLRYNPSVFPNTW